jgi:hypothetical protein
MGLMKIDWKRLPESYHNAAYNVFVKHFSGQAITGDSQGISNIIYSLGEVINIYIAIL